MKLHRFPSLRLLALSAVLVAATGVVGWHAHSHSHGGIVITAEDGQRSLLTEWRLGADAPQEPTTIDDGLVSLALENTDRVKHSFVLVRTETSADALPQIDGRIDLDAAGDVVANIDDVGPGGTSAVQFDIAPGTYVLFCNTTGHYLSGMYYALNVQ